MDSPRHPQRHESGQQRDLVALDGHSIARPQVPAARQLVRHANRRPLIRRQLRLPPRGLGAVHLHHDLHLLVARRRVPQGERQLVGAKLGRRRGDLLHDRPRAHQAHGPQRRRPIAPKVLAHPSRKLRRPKPEDIEPPQRALRRPPNAQRGERDRHLHDPAAVGPAHLRLPWGIPVAHVVARLGHAAAAVHAELVVRANVPKPGIVRALVPAERHACLPGLAQILGRDVHLHAIILEDPVVVLALKPSRPRRVRLLALSGDVHGPLVERHMRHRARLGKLGRARLHEPRHARGPLPFPLADDAVDSRRRRAGRYRHTGPLRLGESADSGTQSQDDGREQASHRWPPRARSRSRLAWRSACHCPPRPRHKRGTPGLGRRPPTPRGRPRAGGPVPDRSV